MREQICQRVELILDRKESTSLEELAEILAGKRKEQQSRRKLILENGFDRREYSVEELQSAMLTDGDREISILDYLREVSL